MTPNSARKTSVVVMIDDSNDQSKVVIVLTVDLKAIYHRG
jgi:hypothetical protein